MKFRRLDRIARRLTATLLAFSALSTASLVTAGTLHSVVVGDNFFSPSNLTIDVGDSVRWTNAAGIHNVYSCTADQTGCEGQVAIERFDNGLPRSGLWSYTHTFTQTGTNPYLCQSHATFMKGTVTVNAAAPPPVPDGVFGTPMTVVESNADGSVLTITWDDATCGAATGHRILHGTHESFPEEAGPYAVDGGVCGVSSPHDWIDVPEAPTPGRLVWWIVVADDGSSTEGSWGRATDGEREGPLASGASGACDATLKAVKTCGASGN